MKDKRIIALIIIAIAIIVLVSVLIGTSKKTDEPPATTVTATTIPTTKPPIPASAKIENVPYINQIAIGFPMGCEAVSATMLLNFYGYDVSVQQMIDAVPTGSGKYEKDGVWYAADPFEMFAGDPRKRRTEGSYGCFAKPLLTAMNKFAEGRAKDISGAATEELLRYVSEGKPVVVWGASNGNTIKEGVVWQCVDKDGKPTGKTFTELEREHCMVLIGYDEENVVLHDPSKGENILQTKGLFNSNREKLFMQAIIIE